MRRETQPATFARSDCHDRRVPHMRPSSSPIDGAPPNIAVPDSTCAGTCVTAPLRVRRRPHGPITAARLLATTATRRRAGELHRRRRIASPTASSASRSARRSRCSSGSGTGTAASSRCVYSSWGSVRICSRVPDLDELALLHHGDALGEDLDDGEVVGDEQAGEADLPLQLLEQVEHAGLHRHVERRRRLVGDQQAWARAPAPGRCRPAGAARRTARAGSGCAGRAPGGPGRAAPRPACSASAPLATFCSSSGSPIDSPTGSRGLSDEPGSWNTKLTSRRTWRRSSLEMPTMFVPSTDRRALDERQQPDDRPPDRRLARPGLADEPDDLAGPDRQGRRRRRRGTPAPGPASGTRWRRRGGRRPGRARRRLGGRRRARCAAGRSRDRRRTPWTRPRRGAGRRRSSCCVYGSLRARGTPGSTGPASTIRPRCITITRSARSATTPMSWVISRMPASMRSRRSRTSLRISACTVTSSAVVGSSAMSSVGSQRQRLGDHRPLPLAARQLVRVGVDAPLRVGDLDELEQLDRPLAGRLRRHRLVAAQHLGDLEPDRVHRVERRHRLLEDHRHDRGRGSSAARARRARRARGRRARIEPRTDAFFGSRPISAIADRRLAGARLADDRQRLAGVRGRTSPRSTAGYHVPSTQKSTSRSRTCRRRVGRRSARRAARRVTGVLPSARRRRRCWHDGRVHRGVPAVVRPRADRRHRPSICAGACVVVARRRTPGRRRADAARGGAARRRRLLGDVLAPARRGRRRRRADRQRRCARSTCPWPALQRRRHEVGADPRHGLRPLHGVGGAGTRARAAPCVDRGATDDAAHLPASTAHAGARPARRPAVDAPSGDARRC